MPEPIGQELSINLEACPELAGVKKGEKVELTIEVQKIGEHIHSIGKTEKMIDVKILSIELDKENDDGEEE